jgi:hypothetical protein
VLCFSLRSPPAEPVRVIHVAHWYCTDMYRIAWRN